MFESIFYIYVSIYLSIYLSIYQATHPRICLFIYLSESSLTQRTIIVRGTEGIGGTSVAQILRACGCSGVGSGT